MHSTPSLPLTVYLAPFAAFAVAAALLATLVRRGGLPLDHPNPRSLHNVPVPRSGGLALIAGIGCAWLLLPQSPAPALWGAALLLAAVSFVDDARGVAIPWRFAAHFIAAGLLIASEMRAADGAVAMALVLLATVWLTNLYNFMDGSDGLAGGMTVIGFGSYAIAAALHGDIPFALVNACVAFAAAAFLIFNFHPARIFMGDAGSIPLGFLAAALGLAGWEDGLWPAWFPAAVFSPFIVDASTTLARRARRGEKVWQAHREHYYQRLVRCGFGHRNTALAEYALMTICGAAALAGIDRSPGTQAGIVAVMAAAYLVLILSLERAWRTHRAPST